MVALCVYCHKEMTQVVALVTGSRHGIMYRSELTF
jgi:hypothetical protein